MLILGIDPGTTHSGFVVYHDGAVIESGVEENAFMLIRIKHFGGETVAIEKIASYGMAVGAEVFETCFWIGRFMQVWHSKVGEGTLKLLTRLSVKLHLCKSPKAKDANIRQAIIDLYGGKAEAIGTVKKQGPLYGVKSHAWAALAVAITAANT